MNRNFVVVEEDCGYCREVILAICCCPEIDFDIIDISFGDPRIRKVQSFIPPERKWTPGGFIGDTFFNGSLDRDHFYTFLKRMIEKEENVWL